MLQPSLTQRLGRVDDGLHFGDDGAGRDRRAGDGRDRALVLRQRKTVALTFQIVAPGTVGGVGRLGAEAGGLGMLGDVHTGAVIVAVETDDHGDHALCAGERGLGDVAGLLENEIVNVYGAALVDLASLDNNALFCVACFMILMGEGNIAELEACGVRLSMVDQSYFVRDYPIFGLDPAERSFTCLGTEDNGRLRLRKLVAEVRPELVPRAA